MSEKDLIYKISRMAATLKVIKTVDTIANARIAKAKVCHSKLLKSLSVPSVQQLEIILSCGNPL
ncbi:hypothetical protein [Bacillus sp. FJAT-22090]|uniref:hypothetical protein n=1 Tax=Bacillus sp. FJAT-22090 TaxID=1581038 RepID=UPI0016424F03|nr:hypothetical protein [Bacillus sp. FJAT-22090]